MQNIHKHQSLTYKIQETIAGNIKYSHFKREKKAHRKQKRLKNANRRQKGKWYHQKVKKKERP